MFDDLHPNEDVVLGTAAIGCWGLSQNHSVESNSEGLKEVWQAVLLVPAWVSEAFDVHC